MAAVGNWVSERTLSIGSGDITLGGVIDPSHSKFQGNIPTGECWYSISDDNNNREAGIGTFDGTNGLARTIPQATMVGGVYNGNSPTPISLSGLAVVSVTFNRTAYEDLLNGMEANTQAIADLDVRVGDNETNIATNTANIATNTADILTNTGNIATNTNDILNKVDKTGDVMTGVLEFTDGGGHGYVDVEIDPYQGGHALTFLTDDGVRMSSPYIVMVTDNQIWTMPGAVAGDNVVVAGLTASGAAQLGYQHQTNQSNIYDDETTTPVLIKAAGVVPPSPAVLVGLGVTLTADLAAGQGSVSTTIPLINNTNRNGSVEFGTRLNGVTDTWKGNIYAIPRGYIANISYTAPISDGFVSGDTIELIARVIDNNNNAFELSTNPTVENPAILRVTQGVASGADASDVVFTPTGNITADNVQTGMVELDTIKLQKDSGAMTGTPTAPTAAQGTDTTQIATTQFVNDVSIGEGQAWVDLIGSRSIQTDYTNDTGRSIQVSVSRLTHTGATAKTANLQVDGIVVAVSDTAGTIQIDLRAAHTVIVPAGSVYRAGGNAALMSWAELR